MVPARTTSPVWRFTPRRLALESRPLRELPPPFLCAIGWILLGFGCPCSLRCGGLLGRSLVSLSLDRLFNGELSHSDLSFDGLGCDRNCLGLHCDFLGFDSDCLGLRRRFSLGRLRRGGALGRGRLWLCFGAAAAGL